MCVQCERSWLRFANCNELDSEPDCRPRPAAVLLEFRQSRRRSGLLSTIRHATEPGTLLRPRIRRRLRCVQLGRYALPLAARSSRGAIVAAIGVKGPCVLGRLALLLP